ncbi:hypothetical protein LXL04_020162 [Taraxacum kok-saghyz]
MLSTGEEKWTEVRRRKKSDKGVSEEVTTYFVTNVPKEGRKGEIRNVFSKFGRVTDVYMGLKIGKNGKYYAFIRIMGAGDAKELEERMNGAKIRGKELEVNVAKHDRRAIAPAPAPARTAT